MIEQTLERIAVALESIAKHAPIIHTSGQLTVVPPPVVEPPEKTKVKVPAGRKKAELVAAPAAPAAPVAVAPAAPTALTLEIVRKVLTEHSKIAGTDVVMGIIKNIGQAEKLSLVKPELWQALIDATKKPVAPASDEAAFS